MIVSHKGKYKNVSPFVISVEDILSDEVGRAIYFCPLARIPFMILCNDGCTTGVNKTVSALANEPGKFIYGPAIFVLLDQSYAPTHMRTDFFKKHVLSLL